MGDEEVGLIKPMKMVARAVTIARQGAKATVTLT
jgi:hypothetical protein